MALRDRGRRRRLGPPRRRRVASGDRRRAGLRGRHQAGAVRRREDVRASDARHGAGGPRRGRGTARRLAGGRRARPSAEMAVRAAPARRAAARVSGRRATTYIGGDAATARILFSYANAAAHACDLAAELRRRAQKLAEAPPKLRAKGAKAALQARLDEDSLAAATDRRPLRARNTPTVRTARRARRDPRTDGTRDVPALRALAMARSGKNWGELDRELGDLPPPLRWREWRRLCSPPPGRSCAKIWRGWSARVATSI